MPEQCGGGGAVTDAANGGNTGGLEWHEAPVVEGGASLIVSPDKRTIRVTVTTSDGSRVTVEGCDKTELVSGTYTELKAKGTKVVLKGKITELYCYNNQLTALNVQGLSALQSLDCSGNKLTELNVQGLSALQSLGCHDNKLTSLDIQGCTALSDLRCGGNEFITLNVQGLNALQRLYCYKNQLTELNVQGLSALRELRCYDNKLTSLNVQGCNALYDLWCSGNKLTELNVQDCTALQELWCYDNKLTSLDIQGCTTLRVLLCHGNQLTAEVFTKLFNDLPTRTASDNARAVLYTERTGDSEANCTNFATPESLKITFDGAKAKHWKFQAYDKSDDLKEI